MDTSAWILQVSTDLTEALNLKPSLGVHLSEVIRHHIKIG